MTPRWDMSSEPGESERVAERVVEVATEAINGSRNYF